MSNDKKSSDSWAAWLVLIAIILIAFAAGNRSDSPNGDPNCYSTAQDQYTGGC